MGSMYSFVRKHLINIPGKRLDKRYVIFESDDWGSERIPSVMELNKLKQGGFDVSSNPFNYLDSLESADDLSALFEVLLKYKDKNGNHPVITANSVVANPDYTRIRNSEYNEYFFEGIAETYKKKKGSERSLEIINEGIKHGMFYPQFHGREHLNVRQWMAALKNRNDEVLKAFELGISGIDVKNEFSKRSNLTAAFDGITESDRLEHNKIMDEGIELFNKIYGFYPKSFIAPCYVWHPVLEDIMYSKGIRYIQGIPFQLAPSRKKKYRRILHYQGQKNKKGLFYFIRNCFFEPSLNSGNFIVEECINRLKIIFSWGKPAVIGTHRINFIGGLDENNRKNNLKLFEELLKAMLKTWPDIEFITTDKLGGLYNRQTDNE